MMKTYIIAVGAFYVENDWLASQSFALNTEFTKAKHYDSEAAAYRLLNFMKENGLQPRLLCVTNIIEPVT